jgi:hypothetical protein
MALAPSPSQALDSPYPVSDLAELGAEVSVVVLAICRRCRARSPGLQLRPFPHPHRRLALALPLVLHLAELGSTTATAVNAVCRLSVRPLQPAGYQSTARRAEESFYVKHLSNSSTSALFFAGGWIDALADQQLRRSLKPSMLLPFMQDRESKYV